MSNDFPYVPEDELEQIFWSGQEEIRLLPADEDRENAELLLSLIIEVRRSRIMYKELKKHLQLSHPAPTAALREAMKEYELGFKVS